MQTLILTLHIIVCFLLVILVLLQSGKEGMGVIFGGGNSSVFGSTGAGGILAKLTTLMAIVFVITSLSYTYVTSSHTDSDSTILNVQIEEVPVPTQGSHASDATTAPEEGQATPAPVTAPEQNSPDTTPAATTAPAPSTSDSATTSQPGDPEAAATEPAAASGQASSGAVSSPEPSAPALQPGSPAPDSLQETAPAEESPASSRPTAGASPSEAQPPAQN